MGFVRTLSKELHNLLRDGVTKDILEDAFIQKPDKVFEDEINPFAVFFERMERR